MVYIAPQEPKDKFKEIVAFLEENLKFLIGAALFLAVGYLLKDGTPKFDASDIPLILFILSLVSFFVYPVFQGKPSTHSGKEKDNTIRYDKLNRIDFEKTIEQDIENFARKDGIMAQTPRG